MCKMSVLLGCLATFAFIGASAAAPLGSQSARVEFHFSRPATTMAVFHQDQVACKRAAVTVRWGHRYSIGMPSGGVYRSWSPTDFLRCMTNKGYRLDPSGYSTGPMRAAI
jgi:hypothetical protein